MGAWGRPLALRYPALCWSRSNPKPSKWISHTPQSPLSQFFPEGKTNYSYTGSTRATWGSFHERINPSQERECRHPRTPQSRSGLKPKTLNSLQAQVRVFISGARAQRTQGHCVSKSGFCVMESGILELRDLKSQHINVNFTFAMGMEDMGR